MTEAYGSTSIIISRVGAEPSGFGFEDDDETSAQDQLEEFITELRERASSEVIEYCGQVFSLVEGETDVLRGSGRQEITTRNYPVQEIHAIREGSRTIDDSQYELVTTPGRPDRNSGRIERRRRRWASGREITVEYDWGYAKTPSVVDSVVEDTVVEVLEKADVDRQSSAKQSESMDGYSISWDNSDIADAITLTEAMQTRLDPLRRRGRA